MFSTHSKDSTQDTETMPQSENELSQQDTKAFHAPYPPPQHNILFRDIAGIMRYEVTKSDERHSRYTYLRGDICMLLTQQILKAFCGSVCPTVRGELCLGPDTLHNLLTAEGHSGRISIEGRVETHKRGPCMC